MARLWVALLLVLVTVIPAAGQTVSTTTGAMNGTVTDNTKSVLPGVTVTIAGRALMGTRSDVTNENGQYRFAAVPPGDYRLTFELTGFGTIVREGIKVGLGFTATINVELGLATQQESITVVGQSPVVDTASTKLTTNYTAEEMAAMPTARDFAALMSTSPAVKVNRTDVGGSASLSENSYRVYGTQGQDRPMLEGMLSSEGTALLFYTDYGSFSEVSVGAAGNTAEMSGPGVFSQFIAKSGGNDYRGSFYLDYYGEGFSTRNIDDAQIGTGLTGGPAVGVRDLNRTNKYRDINGDVGGYLKRDRLWWYGSFRKTVNEVNKPNFPVGPQYTEVSNRTAKLTYNLNQSNKFIAFVNHNNKSQPNRLSADRIYLDDRSTWNQVGFPVGVWKGEWNWVASDAAFLEVRAGRYFYSWRNRSKSDDPRREDVATGIVSGGDRFFDNDRGRPQLLTSLSYFKDGWGGTHNFKVGAELMDEWFYDIQGGYPGDVLHSYRNGAPIEVFLYETPNVSRNGLRTYSGYVQDTWQTQQRVTLNLGLRFDRYRNYLQEQTHPTSRFNATEDVFAAVDELASFNNWGPRVGVSWDATGDGRTLLKFNTGVYRNSPGPNLFNPNPALWFTRYAWADANGNGLWERGEEGRLIANAGGITNEAIDPNLQMGVTKEVAAFGERELLPNFGIRSGIVFRRQTNPLVRRDVTRPFDAFSVPVSIADPGPDGVVGTADDGQPIFGRNLNAASLAQTPFNERTSLADTPSDYMTWEVTATRRMSSWWSIAASYAKTWSTEVPAALNPNQLINVGSENKRQFSNWQGKIHGSLRLPYDVTVSPILRMESGLPWARTVSASFNYGSETILAEEFGSRRLDHIILADVRVEKGITVMGRRLSGFVDGFNLTNDNPEQTIIQSSGAAFLRPTVVVAPRVFRVGVKLDF